MLWVTACVSISNREKEIERENRLHTFSSVADKQSYNWYENSCRCIVDEMKTYTLYINGMEWNENEMCPILTQRVYYACFMVWNHFESIKYITYQRVNMPAYFVRAIFGNNEIGHWNVIKLWLNCVGMRSTDRQIEHCCLNEAISNVRCCWCCCYFYCSVLQLYVLYVCVCAFLSASDHTHTRTHWHKCTICVQYSIHIQRADINYKRNTNTKCVITFINEFTHRSSFLIQ